MKNLAITLLLCAMASGAQAAGDRSSLFSCGVRFGSTELTYSPEAETKSQKSYRALNQRLLHVAGAVTEPRHFNLPRSADARKTEKRLPPKFTFATVGCSWR